VFIYNASIRATALLEYIEQLLSLHNFASASFMQLKTEDVTDVCFICESSFLESTHI